MFGECLYNIALRQDANDAVIGTEDDDRADASLSHQFRCRDNIGGRVDRDDVAAFASQNILDNHGSLLCSGLWRTSPRLLSIGNDPPRGGSRQETDSAVQ